MKVNFNKQTLYTLIIGMCVGAVAILATLVLTGGVPWLRAAGVGTGAPDVNARYLDGYTTATTTTANSIYISETTTGYIPDNTVDSSSLVDGTALSEILDDDGTGSGLDADTVDGTHGSSLNPTICAGRIYLTATTFNGGHNCDDVPATCCASGYHMCNYTEPYTTHCMVEYTGTDRLSSIDNVVGWYYLSGANNCVGSTATTSTNFGAGMSGGLGSHVTGALIVKNLAIQGSQRCNFINSVWCCSN